MNSLKKTSTKKRYFSSLLPTVTLASPLPLIIVTSLMNAPLPYWWFQKHERWEAFLKTWKCLISWRESAKAATKGPLDPSIYFIGVDYRTGGLENSSDDRPSWKLENVLSPGGRLLCRLLRGPFVFNLGFIGVDYRTGGFKIHMGKCVFETPNSLI